MEHQPLLSIQIRFIYIVTLVFIDVHFCAYAVVLFRDLLDAMVLDFIEIAIDPLFPRRVEFSRPLERPTNQFERI